MNSQASPRLESLTEADVAALRAKLAPRSAIQNLGDALAFVTQADACATWSSIGGLPSLAEHLADGADHQIVWQAQEDLPRTREGFYGKVFAGKGTVLSRPMLAELATAAGGFDVAERHAAGRLSADAKAVGDQLRINGPASSTELRSKAGFDGKAQAKAFENAMSELQAQLLVTPIDQIQGNGRFKIPVWELSSVAWSDLDVSGDADEAAGAVVARLAGAARIVRDSELRSWLKQTGVRVDAELSRLVEQGVVSPLGKVGRAVVYSHASAGSELG